MADGQLVRPGPRTLPFPFDIGDRCILACGSETKNTFCIVHDGLAIVSSDNGDLTDYDQFRKYRNAIKEALDQRGATPDVVACDLHDDYVSTRHALDLGCEVVRVQHHHAHMAACMTEHGVQDNAIGVTFDGLGLGTDGTLWGGEILLGTQAEVTRAAHLKPYALPGGDSATLYPARMAYSVLLSDVENADEAAERLLPELDADTRDTIRRMLDSRARSPLTSSAGRLFDAVSTLLGFSGKVESPGAPAIRLEQLAADSSTDESYPFRLEEGIIDISPAINIIVKNALADTDKALIARMFHNTIAVAATETCGHVAADNGVDSVFLSGGVFYNHILTDQISVLLKQRGLKVYNSISTQPGDGSLSYGQASVAAARMCAQDGA